MKKKSMLDVQYCAKPIGPSCECELCQLLYTLLLLFAIIVLLLYAFVLNFHFVVGFKKVFK